MIRIKAPRVWRLGVPGYRASYYRETRMGAAPGRFYSEAMHRRVLALVRACEKWEAVKDDSPSQQWSIADAELWHQIGALRAQAEKDGRK